MFVKNRLAILQNKTTGNDDGGGGGNTPDISALVAAEVEKQVSGLKAKNQELIDMNKAIKDQLKQFDGIDPVKTKELFARVDNDAEAKLISEGKISEVINARTEKLTADYNKRIEDAKASVEAANKRAQAFEGRVLDDSIRAAAAAVGVHPQAIDDALFRGRSMFKLGEDGKAFQPGADGSPVLGKDGKTVFTPQEWLEGMKTAAPHWFPNGSSGGGSNGNKNASPTGKTMTRSQFDALSPAEQSNTHKSGVTVVDQ